MKEKVDKCSNCGEVVTKDGYCFDCKIWTNTVGGARPMAPAGTKNVSGVRPDKTTNDLNKLEQELEKTRLGSRRVAYSVFASLAGSTLGSIIIYSAIASNSTENLIFGIVVSSLSYLVALGLSIAAVLIL